MKQKVNFSLFLFGLILISLDAYTIFNIPLTWIGQIILFFWVILNFKLIKLPPKKTFLLIFFLLMPGFLITFIEFNEIDYLYVGLRIFNVVSFLLLFTYFSKIQDQNFINNFHKSMQIILLFLSSITIYIFVAQLFDLPEPIRNRANTSFFSNSKQSTFWISQPHRAMGTFREPSFVVAFLFPLAYISILKNIYINKYTILLCSIALGLTRSDFVRLFCLIILTVELFNYLKFKNVNLKIISFSILIFVFSTFGILECNINPSSVDCVEFQDTVEKINDSGNLKVKINENTISDNFDNERLEVLKYFFYALENLSPKGLNNVNIDFQSESFNKISEEMYLTNRTNPNYLTIRFSTQNFGTGNYSLIKYNINVQNIIIFYTLAFGIHLTIFVFLIFLNLIFLNKNNENFVYFLIICLLIFLNPIEEVNSFYGFIIGYAFYIFKIESRQNEYI